MNIRKLRRAIGQIKADLESAITTATFDGESYENGQRAKEALIRSSRLILQIHEVTKESLNDVLQARNISYAIHPPIGSSSPELEITGFIKKKRQDIVVLIENTYLHPETIASGPLQGSRDPVGQGVTQTSIVIGVRSQLSSVAKNFDTLMERAFAETLNLRLRIPTLVMGEVYLLPVVEYDDEAMKRNRIGFKRQPIDLSKFIRTFISISGRAPNVTDDLYKYERTALVVADFRNDPPDLCLTPADLTRVGVAGQIAAMYPPLSPTEFAPDIVRAHSQRHRLT